ncbi:glycylpeptide N-tetradecanoyltransferase 1 [Theileria orientalis]|uniref:Glycylpeptide N-tetradecanoyltransferase n=1 Tax=Theileria orientalis TaxID=68886 RepID=A0A976QTE0_THEOR|nr:glycylpeptide N-tetradecanoyltransferase 1 [Theileria orientalis]
MEDNLPDSQTSKEKEEDSTPVNGEDEESLSSSLSNLRISVSSSLFNILQDSNGDKTEELRQKILQRLSLTHPNLQTIEHKFWDTQLVSKLDDVVTSNDCGPINPNQRVEDVRKDPYPLPSGFEWVILDITNEEERTQVYTLLNENYVEDGDSLFRFDYKPEFLLWALTTPNYKKEWQIGVRVSSSKLLVGYITAIPVTVNIVGKNIKAAEVNFLCIHKKLRTKRLAPVLIKEITRRVNLCGIWQAVYTAGIVIPKPIASCRYWHRPLDIKKLISARFSGVGKRMTISRAVRLYKVNEVENNEMRPMEKKDVSSLYKLLKDHLNAFKLYQVFTQDEVHHLFLPQEGIIHTYVKSVNGNVTDMCSFYSLPSSVINNPKVDKIHAAYSFYNVSSTMTYKRLMEHALFFAKQKEYDVFNSLDLMENRQVFEDLKFGMGDGDLHYYMFNYRVPLLNSSEIGMVLL